MYIALLVKASGNEFFRALTILHSEGQNMHIILDFLSAVRLNCRCLFVICSKQFSENQILYTGVFNNALNRFEPF